MPMNATWPNETMPLLPMNVWIDTTSITLTRNITYVRLEDDDPNACTSAMPPTSSSDRTSRAHERGPQAVRGDRAAHATSTRCPKSPCGRTYRIATTISSAAACA